MQTNVQNRTTGFPHMSNDPYAGIFDNASVADFIEPVASTAVHTSNNHHEDFPTFVETQVELLRRTMGQSNNLEPVAILANAGDQRVFTATPEETIGEFLQRLGGEARQMRATWVFCALATQVNSVLVEVAEGDELADIGEGGQPDVPVLHEGLIWYAEESGTGGRQFQNGALWKQGKVINDRRNGVQPFALMQLILDI